MADPGPSEPSSGTLAAATVVHFDSAACRWAPVLARLPGDVRVPGAPPRLRGRPADYAALEMPPRFGYRRPFAALRKEVTPPERTERVRVGGGEQNLPAAGQGVLPGFRVVKWRRAPASAGTDNERTVVLHPGRFSHAGDCTVRFGAGWSMAVGPIGEWWVHVGEGGWKTVPDNRFGAGNAEDGAPTALQEAGFLLEALDEAVGRRGDLDAFAALAEHACRAAEAHHSLLQRFLPASEAVGERLRAAGLHHDALELLLFRAGLLSTVGEAHLATPSYLAAYHFARTFGGAAGFGGAGRALAGLAGSLARCGQHAAAEAACRLGLVEMDCEKGTRAIFLDVLMGMAGSGRGSGRPGPVVVTQAAVPPKAGVEQRSSSAPATGKRETAENRDPEAVRQGGGRPPGGQLLLGSVGASNPDGPSTVLVANRPLHVA